MTADFRRPQPGFTSDECTFVSIIVSLIITLGEKNVLAQNPIRFGLLLPYKGDHPWVMPKVAPAVEYAIQTARSRQLIRRTILTMRDTKCSETEGPLAAIDLYVNRSADVFLGPACNYALAPVARFSPYWAIPVLTSAALIKAFDDKSEYKLLTRMLGTYPQCAHLFIGVFETHRWQKAGILYHDFSEANTGKTECFFSSQGVYTGLEGRFTKPWALKFNEFDPTTDYSLLLMETSRHARSKSLGCKY